MADVSAITQKLLEAQKSGQLGGMVGHEEAAKIGDGPMPTDMAGLVSAFGQSDIDSLSGGGAAAPAPGATPPPAAPGGGAPGAPAPAQLGPPVIPPPPVPAGAAGAGWQASSGPGSLAGNLGNRPAAGPFGTLQDVMSRRGRMY